jgi:hypothetical protein
MEETALFVLRLVDRSFFSTVYAGDIIKYKFVNRLPESDLNDFLNVTIKPSELPQRVNDITQKTDIIDPKEIEEPVSGKRNPCDQITKLPEASGSILSRNNVNRVIYEVTGSKHNRFRLRNAAIDAPIEPVSLCPNAIGHTRGQWEPTTKIYPNCLLQNVAYKQYLHAGTGNLILKEKTDRRKAVSGISYGSYKTFNAIFFRKQNNRFNYCVGSTYGTANYPIIRIKI